MKRFSFIAIWAALVALGYASGPQTPPDERLQICLRWCQGYPAETGAHVREGVAWTLSHLGANLPKGSMERVWTSNREAGLFNLNLQEAGFSAPALGALVLILDSLKRTEEYARFCSIDLGRFVALTVHSPHHYYRITGTPPTLDGFKALHQMDEGNNLRFPVLYSAIASGNRLVEFKTGTVPTQWAFVAAEGWGRVELGNFEAAVYEAFDIMPNGQLRFAVYDAKGQLLPATPETLGEAGKPGNCMWCHESSIQPLFTVNHCVPGQLTVTEFLDTVRTMKRTLLAYQKARRSDLHFDSVYAHVQHELLYTTFMEPSLERVAREWELPINQVKARLGHLPQHRNNEFPWMGTALYHRRDIEPLAPYRASPVPHEIRHPSGFEPDFFR